MIKRIIILFIAAFFAGSVNSQEVTINTDYPSVVQNGQRFTITYSVNAGGGEFAVPSFTGFQRLMGPQTSYSSSTQIINGKVTQETNHSYTYYVQAASEGKFVIPPAQFTLKNRTYYSDSIRIEVIGGNAAPAQSHQTNQVTADVRNPELSDESISIAIIPDKKEAYIGENIGVVVKLFTRRDLSGINEIKFPAFTGFMKTDIETPPLTSLRQENINGTVWGTGVIQQFLLYPQMTGEIVIDPVQIVVLVQQKSGASDPFFGDFFSTYQTVPRSVASKPVKVTVKPLPGTTPDDFSGVVGKLSINASLSKDSVNVNDAVNLKITISGSGNLKIAEAPLLQLSPDIEKYDPKISDNIKNGPSGSTGQRTFEYILIPRHYGDFTIPSVSYSYFNSSTGRYEKLTTPEFKFHARKGEITDSGITLYGGVSKQDIRYVGKDIRFIKSGKMKLLKPGNTIISKRSFLSIYPFALFTFFVILFLRREVVRRNSDLMAVRNRKAAKVASRRLKDAEASIKKGENERFLEEIHKALWGYLSDKLNIPVSELTRSGAIEALTSRKIGEENITRLNSLLDRCEFARYAPSSDSTGMRSLFEEASSFIKSIENSII